MRRGGIVFNLGEKILKRRQKLFYMLTANKRKYFEILLALVTCITEYRAWLNSILKNPRRFRLYVHLCLSHRLTINFSRVDMWPTPLLSPQNLAQWFTIGVCLLNYLVLKKILKQRTNRTIRYRKLFEKHVPFLRHHFYFLLKCAGSLVILDTNSQHCFTGPDRKGYFSSPALAMMKGGHFCHFQKLNRDTLLPAAYWTSSINTNNQLCTLLCC